MFSFFGLLFAGREVVGLDDPRGGGGLERGGGGTRNLSLEGCGGKGEARGQEMQRKKSLSGSPAWHPPLALQHKSSAQRN